MPFYKKYGYDSILKDISLTHESTAAYSQVVTILPYERLLFSYDATIALTGGSTPGIKFTVEADTTGDGNWVALTTLVATAKGYVAAAPADPTITTTGKEYRVYHVLVGVRIRVKYEIEGTPTGGTAKINSVNIVAN